jgi:hypothetical protein
MGRIRLRGAIVLTGSIWSEAITFCGSQSPRSHPCPRGQWRATCAVRFAVFEVARRQGRGVIWQFRIPVAIASLAVSVVLRLLAVTITYPPSAVIYCQYVDYPVGCVAPAAMVRCTSTGRA